jgi:hypothetical protein
MLNSPDNLSAAGSDVDKTLRAYPFNIQSSTPPTPTPVRNGADAGCRNNDNYRESGGEGANQLLCLAANPTSQARMEPRFAPLPKTPAEPSFMMTTLGGDGGDLLSMFNNPQAPFQAFQACDFSDFINTTPSTAQNAWPETPLTHVQTPTTVGSKTSPFQHLYCS